MLEGFHKALRVDHGRAITVPRQSEPHMDLSSKPNSYRFPTLGGVGPAAQFPKGCRRDPGSPIKGYEDL